MKESTAVKLVKEPASLKVVSPDDFFKRVEGIYDTVARRAFEIFENNGRQFGRDLENWFRAESELLHPVHIEVVESEGNLGVKAEVPGFKPEELEVKVEPNRLTITGKREATEERKEGKTIYSERRASQILRTIELPAAVETEKATANLNNGVLELNLPKAASARKVPIGPKTV